MASKVGLFSRLECETSGMGSRLTTMSLLEPRVRLKRAPTPYFKDFGFKLRLLRLLLQRSVLRKKKVGKQARCGTAKENVRAIMVELRA